MPRGGYREGAGGKPSWKHGKTQTIRVPVALSDELLEIARKLDEGKTLDSDTKSNSALDLRGIKIYKVRDQLTVSLSDLRAQFSEVLVSEDKLPKSKSLS